MLGFHLMMIGLWNQIVAPPSTTTRASVIHSIRWMGWRVSLSTATCTSVITLITIVPSRTGASSVPTTPPDTMKPNALVAMAAAHSLCLSAYWKVPKKRINGRKSRNSFIGGARVSRSRSLGRAGWALHGSLLLRLEVYRCRVDAETFPRRGRPVLEHVAQVRAAVVAAHFHPHHAVRGVHHALDDLAVHRLEVAGPAAAGVELGVRLEQRRAAAYAFVLAWVPVVPVFAGEGPLGGGVARHLVLHWVELGTPFGVGLLDLVVAHGGGLLRQR